jgi:hypothetical protein
MPQSDSGSRNGSLHPGATEGQGAGEPLPIPLARDRRESPAPARGDLGWIRQLTEEIRQHRLEAEDVSSETLDQWVKIASIAEREGKQSALNSAFEELMEQARSLLQIDVVCPQLGSSALQQSVEVVDNGPLDGTVAEVVSVGLRTPDIVLRRARVKSWSKDSEGVTG